MADDGPSSSANTAAPESPPMKENLRPMDSRLAELAESREELVGRVQGLKEELQNWRLKLDTQVKTYKNELSELKMSLNTELEKLKSEFQELRTTLEQQQDEVTSSLKGLGLQDLPKEVNLNESPRTAEQGETVQRRSFRPPPRILACR
ncbi:unnamed protein product [Spirodela intermedia]|uniref:Uncharacterized protein n=1 Tax=Spirodela intermedia TaxID=51605 RepID=A0A7I8KRI5_SPIIN|nr:unnamed protein product [Spirodela intermedia]